MQTFWLGVMDRHTDGQMDGHRQTDTASYRDAMDASKNAKNAMN